jgi:hypothetical protein
MATGIAVARQEVRVVRAARTAAQAEAAGR